MSDFSTLSDFRKEITMLEACVVEDQEMEELAEFGPVNPILNWRKLIVGESRPIFNLEKENV